MALTVSVEEIVAGSNNPVLRGRPDWKKVRLGDIASIQNGGPFDSALFSKSEGHPLIRIRDIARTTTETRFNGEFDPCYVVNSGDLLIGMDGDFNCARWKGQQALLNQRVCCIRLESPEYDERFLDHVLPSFLKAINEATSSVTVKHLSSRTVADIPLPAPPLDIQRAIAGELDKQFSRLDEAVAGLQRVKANLKRYNAAVLKAAVEGRLVDTEADLARHEGRDYETGAQLLQRILATRRRHWQGKGKYKEPTAPDNTDLPELPEGWVWATLPQLGELARGKSKHRPRDDAKLYGGPYPFIQTGDVRRSEGSISEYSQTYSEVGLGQSRLWPKETLCITIAANIAETGILTFDACFPDSVVGFISAMESVTTRYAEFFVRTAKENLERFAPATAQKNINLEVLEAVAVPLPPLPEQHRIVAEVDRLLSIAREAETEVEANLKRAQALRQAILARAFQPATVPPAPTFAEPRETVC
jgi:type I restriction enzyme S subunit